MKIDLKELMDEFSDNLKLDYDLKKKIGLILEENQKFTLKLII